MLEADPDLITSSDHGQVIQKNNTKLGQCTEKQTELETESK